MDYDLNKGLDPKTFGKKTNKPVWWKCSVCIHEHKAPVVRRTSWSGCRKCADRTRTKHAAKL